MHNRKNEMAYLKKEDAESRQSEGSSSESQGSENNRGGNGVEITNEQTIFKISQMSESSCSGLPQIHPHTVSVSVSRTAGVLDERNCSVVDCIPSRSVTHLTSLIDLSGSPACSANYVRGGRLLAKATAVALQVPASPLHEPSAVAASVVHVSTTSRSFFPSLGNADSRLPDGGFSHCTVASPVVECRMPVESRLERGSERNGGNGGTDVRPSNDRRHHISIARRLTEVLQGTGDGDLLLQQTERENGMLQWLQALDLQVMGACRADERLRPMLQLNVSCAGADDRLLAQLSQHFKARELGMLARCLCVPLVSIRVGRVAKQGSLLCPTSVRGHLSLTLLPSSDLRLSFVGDDGIVERLAVLSSGNENSSVVIEAISSDTSGRSFLLRLPGGKLSYFWQSEKSKSVGDELLSKIKDLLGRRPSLSQLTGIRESRLDSFATYLRTSFLGSVSSSAQQGPDSSQRNVSRVNSTEVVSGTTNLSNVSAAFVRPSQRSRLGSSQLVMHGRSHTGNQGSSLSPRTGAFKDGVIRNVSCIRTVASAREKHKRRMDVQSSISIIGCPSFSTVQTLNNSQDSNNNATDSWSTQVSISVTSPNSNENTNDISGNGHGREHVTPLPQRYLHLPVSSVNGLHSQQSLPIGETSFNPFAFHLPASSHMPMSGTSIFSPYYCPCPLRASSLQYTITPPFLPSLSNEAVSLPGPPPASYLSVGSSSAFIPPLPLDLHNVSFSPISLPVPSLVNIPTQLQTSNLPSFLSDPVVRVPLPVSSFVSVPTPQQISSFTPFFSDPIVHIPVIDFHSSGQGYLVSAGPSISSAISPILPGLLSTLIPEPGPANEKEDTHAMQLLTSLRFSSPWRGSEGESCQTTFKSGFPALGNHQNEAERLYAHLEALSNLGEQDSLYNTCSGVISSTLGNQNNICFSVPSQQNGSLLGIVPTVLSSSNLSCLYDVCQDGKSKLTTLVTGSRGLYGGSCDPVVSSNLLAGINQRSSIHSDANLNFHVRNNISGSQNTDSYLQLEEASFDDECSVEEVQKEDSSMK